MKTLLKYFENRVKNIKLLLELPDRKFTTGKFHKLRLEIKKLNALFELINYCAREFKQRKKFKPYKLIFHAAGKVRELQLEEKMLRKYFAKTDLKNYRSSLKENLEKAKEKIFRLIKNKKITRHLKYDLKFIPFINEVNKNCIKKYLEIKTTGINNIISQRNIKPRQLHEIRKRIKTLNYNIMSLPISQQKQTIFKNEVLSELLGRWHDCQVMIRHLEKAMRSEELNLTEAERLARVKKKIASDSQKLLVKINSAIVEKRYFIIQINQHIQGIQ